MENQITTIEGTDVQVITPMQIIKQAVAQGADVDKLEKLLALQERYDANEAKKAFSVALSAFKQAGITVSKNKKISFGQTKYNHATLDNVCDTVGEELSKHGLSFRWHTEQNEGKVKVTCVLMHVQGHSESVSLESNPDTSGSKNSIQAIGSAVTYLQRYTLLSITGTASAEIDDDGRSVMDASNYADHQAAMEGATTQGELVRAYLAAMEAAATAGDKVAAHKFGEMKNAQLDRIKNHG